MNETFFFKYVVMSSLFLKHLVKKIFGQKREVILKLPLLLDLNNIYSNENIELSLAQEKTLLPCTDSHYSHADDFYYFYNPFRCSFLSRAPYGQSVDFKLKIIVK